MHMISTKDLNSAEMDTLTKSCSPATVITANGEVQTLDQTTVYVKELDIFLTMKVLKNTPAFLSLGKLCDENGYSHEWINGQEPHLMKNGIRIQCNTENFAPIEVPGLSASSSSSSRHVSRTHRVALDWLFDRINLDPKIQIICIDTKNQLADMLTKGSFTRDEWNLLLCLFDISHFSSAECSEVMSKRTKKESSEERVTAKSRPMMSLVARAPSTLSSSACYGSQSPWSAKAEKDDRTEQPVVGRDTSHESVHHHKQLVESSYSSSYSEWNVDKTWSSHEWKSDELMMDDRKVRPVVCSERARQFVIENDETETELSFFRIQIILAQGE